VKKLARERAKDIYHPDCHNQDCKVHFDKAKGKGRRLDGVSHRRSIGGGGSIVSCSAT